MIYVARPRPRLSHLLSRGRMKKMFITSQEGLTIPRREREMRVTNAHTADDDYTSTTAEYCTLFISQDLKVVLDILFCNEGC